MSPTPPEAERQAKGDALKVVEVTSMGDLDLEVGAALGDAEIAAAISGGFLHAMGPRLTHAWFFCPGQHGFCFRECFPFTGNRVIENVSLKFEALEHVKVEKDWQLSDRHA
jgi:hypothetical protein